MRTRTVCVSVACLLLSAVLQADRKPPAKTMRHGDFESISYWRIQPADFGTVKSVSGKDNVHSGERAARLDVKKDAKTPSITLYGYYKNSETVYPGETYIVGFWMRGKGKATLTVWEYGRKVEEGKEPFIGWIGRADLGKPVELTDQWQEIKADYTPDKENSSYVSPAVKLEGQEAWALVDDASFVEKASPLTLDVDVKLRIISPGESIDYAFAVKGGKAAKVGILLYDPDDFLIQKTEAAVGEAGTAQGKIDIPKDAREGIYLVRFHVAGSGPGTGRAVEVMSKDLRDQIVALAKKVKFAKAERLMFIGDSLTDMSRGRNYVDKIDLYLRCGDPGQFEVINAGVGGDMIDRVAKRLEKDVLEPKPTHVFIFLGHNDSKVASPEYKKHACEVDVFETTYRDVIKQIKEKTGAKVTIMSATSSVWEICWETAQKRAKENKGHNLFGKPSELELYNELAKKVGKEFGCDYIDLYTPLKDIADKKSYFTPDGVHVSEKGNRLIAIEVLKYLAGNK